MEKNRFKKSDANGNELPEAIGQGRNETHVTLVLEAREKKEPMYGNINVRVTKEEEEKFKSIDNHNEITRAFVRGLIKMNNK